MFDKNWIILNEFIDIIIYIISYDNTEMWTVIPTNKKGLNGIGFVFLKSHISYTSPIILSALYKIFKIAKFHHT